MDDPRLVGRSSKSIERKKRFIAARKAAGLTQQELAEKAGVSLSAVQRVESMSKASNSRAWMFFNMCEVLGVSLDYIWFGCDENEHRCPVHGGLCRELANMSEEARQALFVALTATKPAQMT